MTKPPVPQEGPELISLAFEVALDVHRGQKRKNTTIPYIVHPVGTAIALAKCGCPDHLVAAGLLHDTLEDTKLTLAELEKTFGEAIAVIVQGCSEDKSQGWEDRKRHTVHYLNKASQAIRYVSLADKADNISAIAHDYRRKGEKLWSRFNRGKGHQRWYYENLVVVLRDGKAGEPYRNLHRQFTQTVIAVFCSSERAKLESLLPIPKRRKDTGRPEYGSALSKAEKGMMARPGGSNYSLPVWPKYYPSKKT